MTPLEDLRIRLWTVRQELRRVQATIADAELAAVDHPARVLAAADYLELADDLRRIAEELQAELSGLETEIAAL